MYIYEITNLEIHLKMLKPRTLLLDLMGVWASVTVIVGFMANAAAICLFYRSRRVNILIVVLQ